MRTLLLAAALLFGACLHVLSLGKASGSMHQLSLSDDPAFVLPSPVLKIAVLEHQGLAADLLFLRSMIFIGSALERKEVPRVREGEWKWFIAILDAATDLDPYFLDPYYFANAFLPWDAGRVEEANRLLEKGSRYREWDSMLPFYLGFNQFFFLQDDASALHSVSEAARRPDSDPMLASFASRLAFKGNRTETAVLFLEELAKKTEDEKNRKRYETRISALRSMLALNDAVASFRRKFGRPPADLEELTAARIISRIPRDPYGGTYYLAGDGQVRSTTSSELEPYLSPLKRKMR